MTDDNGDGMMLSRRDAIRGGAALGTMALASRIGAYAQVVEAQITEPRIQLGSDYAIHDNGGNLVINHDPNGDILEYDATADQITTLKPLGANLDLSDNDITNVADLTTTGINIGNIGASVGLSSGQTLSDNTFERIEFDVEFFDDFNAFNTTTHEFTVPSDGKYLIVLFGSVDDLDAGDFCIADLRVDNGSQAESIVYPASTAAEPTAQVLTVLELSKDEVVTGFYRQKSGGPQTLKAGPSTRLIITRIG